MQSGGPRTDALFCPYKRAIGHLATRKVAAILRSSTSIQLVGFSVEIKSGYPNVVGFFFFFYLHSSLPRARH